MYDGDRFVVCLCADAWCTSTVMLRFYKRVNEERKKKKTTHKITMPVKSSIGRGEMPVGKILDQKFFVSFYFVLFFENKFFVGNLNDRFVHWASAIIPPPKNIYIFCCIADAFRWFLPCLLCLWSHLAIQFLHLRWFFYARSTLHRHDYTQMRRLWSTNHFTEIFRFTFQSTFFWRLEYG